MPVQASFCLQENRFEVYEEGAIQESSVIAGGHDESADQAGQD